MTHAGNPLEIVVGPGGALIAEITQARHDPDMRPAVSRERSDSCRKFERWLKFRSYRNSQKVVPYEMRCVEVVPRQSAVYWVRAWCCWLLRFGFCGA